MDNVSSYRLTLLFIVAIVVPSTVLSFVSLGAVQHERDQERSRMRARYQRLARDLAAELDQKVAEPTAELDRTLAELAGRASAARDLLEPLHALAGASRAFRGAALLAQGGTTLVEDATLGGDGDTADPALPGPLTRAVQVARRAPLDDVFRTADELETIGRDPAAALEKVDAIERLHPDDDSVRAEALAARARLRSSLGDREAAADAYRRLVVRWPLARDRDGTVLSLGARLELAAMARRSSGDDAAVRSLFELVRFLAIHEDAIPPAQVAFYRDAARERLSELGAELVREAESQALGARRDRDLSRAFAARLRGSLEERLRALSAGTQQSGFLKTDGLPIFYRPLAGRGGAPLGVAALELDVDGLREREFTSILERATQEEGVFEIAERPTSSGGGGEAPPELELARARLRFPLDDLEVAARRREPKGEDALVHLADQMRSWAIGLALLGLAAGAFVMTRAVRKEMKVAELKSDFVTTVTHELKTPLTSIGMFAETLLMGRVSGKEEERECLEIIAKETDRLSRLIDRVLTFSKIEARKKRFDLRLGDLGELALETVELWKTQMRGAPKPFTISVSAMHDLSRVLMDRGSIQEVLLNLISNAYKYGGDGVILDATAHPGERARRIEVTLTKKRRWAIVEVRDWGIGIPRREQRKIFRKFYRTNDMLTRDVEGSGIGLTLAQSIAHAHRGDITVRSKVAHGSTFTLWLPLSPLRGIGPLV